MVRRTCIAILYEMPHPTGRQVLTEKTVIEYRPYARADEEQVLDLLRVALRKQDFPDFRGFWRWKHYENPFGESPGMVAVADGRVVGLRVFLCWEWHAGGRAYRAGRAMDTATHPDWARRGIFEHLTRSMLERVEQTGFDFIFNTPNQYSLPGYLKMGWVLVGRLPLRVRVQKPMRLADALVHRAPLGGATAVTAEADNRAVLGLLTEPPVGALIEEAAAVSETDTTLSMGLHTAKTSTYLQWRYGQNRWYQYVAGFDSRGNSAALAICRISRRGDLRELLVADVVTLPDSRSRRLASQIVGRLARETHADYVVASGLKTEFTWPTGFLPVGRRGPNFTVRPLRPTPAIDPTALSAWAATFGDLELF